MRHWVIIYQKLIWINFITLKANENEFLEKANTSTVGKFASTEQWVHSICVFVLCAYVEECPCFMEQQHRSFHSLWTGTHVPETHTHTHTCVSKTADSAEQSSFPVTKALEVWKQLQQSFCCLSQTHTSAPSPSSPPSPPTPFFVLTLMHCINLTAVTFIRSNTAKVVV